MGPVSFVDWCLCPLVGESCRESGSGAPDRVRKSAGPHRALAGVEQVGALRRPDEVAALRGKAADEVTPAGVLRSYRERKRESDLYAAETR